MNCFSWIKPISVLIHFKYCYCNILSLQLPCLPEYPCQILPWRSETPFQRNPHPVFHWLSYFVLPHPSTRRNYWMYQTICQAKPIKFIINLNLKLSIFQNVQSPRAASFSNLDNTVNKKSLFNTTFIKFSTKQQPLFDFNNPTYACNQPYNHHQNLSSANFRLPIPFLIVHKIFLQTLPSSIPQHFFTSLFLCTATLTGIFPTLAIQAIQAESRRF